MTKNPQEKRLVFARTAVKSRSEDFARSFDGKGGGRRRRGKRVNGKGWRKRVHPVRKQMMGTRTLLAHFGSVDERAIS